MANNYVCFQVVLRYSDGSGMKLIGDVTESIEEACIARDAACEAAGMDGHIVAFGDSDEAANFREAYK